MGEMPASRYRERVMGESPHEATDAGESMVPLDPLPSVHVSVGRVFFAPGLPFFYNRRTNKAICGATTWENFKDWAFSRDCFAFLPPTPTAQEEEEAKPKKIAQDSLFEKLKSRAQGRQKPKPSAAEGEYGE